MTTEIGLKISKATCENAIYEDFVKPYSHSNTVLIDLDLFGTNDEHVIICGENDWGYLMTEMLVPILKFGSKIEKELTDKLSEMDKQGMTKPRAIGLGKNQFRAFDILHRARGIGEPLTKYKGIPVICLEDEEDGLELLGCAKEALPFQ